MRKRSITIAGHRTSLSLEDPFWHELKAIAGRRNTTLTELIAEIDAQRTENLSSALRLFVLSDLQGRLPAIPPD